VRLAGEIVFDSDEAEEARAQGRKVILVRLETSPEDIHGMHAAEGILTTRGGMTSHAAVVARGMGKPCVSGAGSIHVDYDDGAVHRHGQTLKSGDVITIDGSTGQVMRGEIPTIKPELSGDFGRIMEWADEVRKLGCAPMPTPRPMPAWPATSAPRASALCRTEHMFFDGDRMPPCAR
jgi:pyruvate,orthophosphate dikinase